MAKRSGGDNSGISMLALIRQVLIDGKVHTSKQIAEHMQQYMFKGMPVERILDNIKLLLDHHQQVEKTLKGYRLKSGSNLTQVVREVLAEVPLPLSEKEISKLVAKKQGVPADMIRLELDEDNQLAAVMYSSKKYYYLADRKQVNEKVYKLLKTRNKALTIEEIYESLELDDGMKRSSIIFLPREDRRIVKTANKYGLKKKQKPKTLQAEPRHLVNRSDMEKVIAHLMTTQSRMTAQELADTVLNLPLDQTNLRFKLARDPRVKRQDDCFYYELEKEDKEIPVKVKERVTRDFFKVKARMMGSSEVHTSAGLLDRIFGVNLATQEFDYYLEELEEHLLNDDETVLLLDSGWIHKTNEPRAVWSPGAEFQAVLLPSPPSPLQEEKISASERSFLKDQQPAKIHLDEHTIAIRISALDRKYGIARYSAADADCLPSRPRAYEIVMDILEENDSVEGFVLADEKLIRGLEVLYADRLPLEGGFLVITVNPDHPYRFAIRLDQAEDHCTLTRDRLNTLAGLVETDWILPDLIRILFQTSVEKFLSCRQIWLESNLVRQTSRENVLATLKDYNCFLPIKSMDGYYSYDETAGMLRLSARDEPAVVPVEPTEEPAPAVKETIQTGSTVSEQVPVADTAIPVPTAEETEKATKARAKQKLKKDVVRKRRKEADVVPEELPEHLMKLKAFERKLPKLRTTRGTPDEAAPVVPVERPSRIGAVSTSRVVKTRNVHITRKTDSPDTQVLMDIPPLPGEPQPWDTTSFVNPQRGKGFAELQTTLEVLKTFISRVPVIRRTDGSIVIFLDKNDVAVYFRIPPENQECWLAWIPEKSLSSIRDPDVWVKAGMKRAKKSDEGYWWATSKFKGPKGNFRDKNVLEGFEIIGKLLELMEQDKI
ncbi:hypothetical protein JW823_02910 [bacterium]|nr:hypothetical protein [candidate division CSSED10-310 bacterium]